MPKMKTNKGLAKRVKVTARGKVMRHQGGKSHLMSGKPGKQRRQLSREKPVPKARAKRFKQALTGII